MMFGDRMEIVYGCMTFSLVTLLLTAVHMSGFTRFVKYNWVYLKNCDYYNLYIVGDKFSINSVDTYIKYFLHEYMNQGE